MGDIPAAATPTLPRGLCSPAWFPDLRALEADFHGDNRQVTAVFLLLLSDTSSQHFLSCMVGVGYICSPLPLLCKLLKPVPALSNVYCQN